VVAGSERAVRKPLAGLFFPKFDETTLFLMAVTCLLLALWPSGLRSDVASLMESGAPAHLAVIFAWALLGLVLALYHAFSRRAKGAFAKTSMAVFALVTNAAAGLYLGVGRLVGTFEGGRWVALINIAAAVLLIYEIGIRQADTIEDSDASPWDLLIGVAALGVLFVYFEGVRRFPWPLTFSLCMVYATFIHGATITVTREVRGWARVS